MPYKDNLIQDPERGNYAIRHDSNTTFQPEEIVAMILKNMRLIAEAFMKGKVRDCVITVRIVTKTISTLDLAMIS